MKFLLGVIAAVLMAGCVSTDQRTVEGVNTLPRDQQPAYLASQREKGAITQARYEDMMAQWRANKAAEEDEKAALASMTPKERTQYRLAKESVELQRQQVAASQAQAYAAGAALTQSAAQNSSANLNQSVNTQQIVNAINAQ